MKKLFIDIRDYYVEHLEVIRGMTEGVYGYLGEQKLEKGICCVAFEVFTDDSLYWNNSIYLRPFLNEVSNHVCKTPYHCNTKEEIIETMEYRINILNQIISNLDEREDKTEGI